MAWYHPTSQLQGTTVMGLKVTIPGDPGGGEDGIYSWPTTSRGAFDDLQFAKDFWDIYHITIDEWMLLGTPLGENQGWYDTNRLPKDVGLLEMDSTTILDATQIAFPPAIDRRDIPQNQTILQVTPIGTHIEYLGNAQSWIVWQDNSDGTKTEISRTGAPTNTTNQGIPQLGAGTVFQGPISDGIIADSEEPEVSIIEDIYNTIDTQWGGLLPGGVEPTYGGGFFPTGGTPGPTTTLPVSTGPVIAPGGMPPAGMVYKRTSCGDYKWVKQKRRRRKSLCTKSDLACLASLKGVLGGGKAFEVWIATHS